MAVNKVIYGGETLIDLTADTVTEDKLLKNYTAHAKDGSQITGTCTFDVDSQDATVAVAEILLNKTAYARGTMLTGTMPNNGKVTGTISTKAEKYTVPQGYHDGSGTVSISSTEQSKIIGSNIRKGITILGVTGTMDEDEENPQTGIEITPSTDSQTITPAEGYTCFREVVVKAIPYVESPNSAGGTTVTIA